VDAAERIKSDWEKALGERLLVGTGVFVEGGGRNLAFGKLRHGDKGKTTLMDRDMKKKGAGEFTGRSAKP